MIGRLLDILLLPGNLYRRLTDKKAALYAGIILIGFLDLLFLSEKNIYSILISMPSGSQLAVSIILICILAVVIGFVDVLFFTLPLFDLYKHFKKEADVQADGRLLVRVMKVYITANLLLLPASTLYYLMFNKVNFEARPDLVGMALNLTFLILIWFCAAVSRGMNSIYNFKPLFKRLSLISIFLWYYLLSWAFQYVINHWVIGFFK